MTRAELCGTVVRVIEDAMNDRIYQYLSAQTLANGYPPSLSEIREHVGLASKSSVHRRLQQLVDSGHVEQRDFRGAVAYFPTSSGDRPVAA